MATPTTTDFSGTPLSGPAALSVAFTDLSSPTPTGWAWTFGDGGTSAVQNPTHIYAAAGTYTVALTTSGRGADPITNTKVAYITVTAPAPPPAPSFAASDYVAAIQNLFPRGAAWPRDLDATQTAVAIALAAVYGRTDARATFLLADAFPGTAVDLLPEWQSALGVPGPLGTLASTTAGQQAQVIAALTGGGGQSVGYFVSLCAALGYTATITQYKRYTVAMPVNAPIYGDNWAHSWLVTITVGSSNPALETLIRTYAPAHTIVAFGYLNKAAGLALAARGVATAVGSAAPTTGTALGAAGVVAVIGASALTLGASGGVVLVTAAALTATGVTVATGSITAAPFGAAGVTNATGSASLIARAALAAIGFTKA